SPDSGLFSQASVRIQTMTRLLEVQSSTPGFMLTQRSVRKEEGSASVLPADTAEMFVQNTLLEP
ncbi:uncharacterized, partial [Tachysurus ichikawai]